MHACPRKTLGLLSKLKLSLNAVVKLRKFARCCGWMLGRCYKASRASLRGQLALYYLHVVLQEHNAFIVCQIIPHHCV